MFDPFLLLTPILVLAVLALVRFIGCDVVFGLDRPPADPPAAPGTLRLQYGDETVTLSWTASPDATSYRIKYRDSSTGPYTTGSTVTGLTAVEILAYGMTRHYVVLAVNGTAESGPSNEEMATGARALLALVQPFGTPRSFFNGWLGMQITTGQSPLKVVALGRVRYLISPPATPVPIARTHIVKIVLPGAAPTDPAVDVQDAQVSIDPQSGVVAKDFLYETLGTAIVLNANTTYFIVSHETDRAVDPGADAWHDFDTLAFPNPEAILNEGVYQDDSTPGIYTPSSGGPGHTYVPVNLLYHPVP